MYETFLGLHSRPFASTANGENVLFGHSMQKALASTRQCIDRGSGPALIIGAPGVGKSSLLAKLGQHYRDQFHIINMSCSRQDGRQEFLQTVLFELRQPYRGLSEGELRLSLLDFLRNDREKTNGILLLVDDGENMTVEVLDEIRVVSNFVQDGQPRTRLVLVGGYRLEELLNDSRLHLLNQRIASRCFLRNLTHAETDEFVRDQVRRAGGDSQNLFDDDGLQVIFELTEGCPRFVNQLCDHVLILCATCGRRRSDVGMIREAWSDLQCFPDAFPGVGGSSSFCQTQNEVLGGQGKWSIIEFGSLDDASPDERGSSPSDLTSESDFDSFETVVDPSCDSYRSASGDQQDQCTSCSPNHDVCSGNWEVSREDEQDFQSFTTEKSPVSSFSCGSGCNPYESQSVWEPLADDSVAEQPQNHWGTLDRDQTNTVCEQPRATEPESTYIAANPFAEQFDEVEVVRSRFDAEISQCNRASQGLTPADLSCLNPISNSGDLHPQSSLEFVSVGCENDQTGLHTCREASAQFDCQTAHDQPSCDEAPEVHEQFQTREASQACERETSPVMQVSPETTSTQIQQEADALLQQLSNAFGEPIDHYDSPQRVSHGIACDQFSDDEIAGDGNPGEHPCTFRLPSDVAKGATSAGATFEHATSHDAEIRELDSIKRAIEEQNRFSAQAFDRLAEQTNAQSVAEGWRIRPTPSQPETPAFSPPAFQADDREILICQPAEDISGGAAETAERLPFPPTPVSTGRAERMDYQQLFNQLRNLPDT